MSGAQADRDAVNDTGPVLGKRRDLQAALMKKAPRK
jgi:hypothetical protein